MAKSELSHAGIGLQRFLAKKLSTKKHPFFEPPLREIAKSDQK
jgi:hypothetical protein